jgi:hypothetical protein
MHASINDCLHAGQYAMHVCMDVSTVYGPAPNLTEKKKNVLNYNMNHRLQQKVGQVMVLEHNLWSTPTKLQVQFNQQPRFVIH